MPLPSFLQRSPKNTEPERRKGAGASASDDPGPAQVARTRARRRLIGAVVLLAAGVVGFPMLFETQPRPIGVDVPIQVATGSQGQRAIVPPQPVGVAPLPRPPLTEPSAPLEAAAREPAAAQAPAAASAAVVAAPPVPAARATPGTAAGVTERAASSVPAPRPTAAPAASAPRAVDGARAQALLDGSAAKRPAAASAPPDTRRTDARPADDRGGRFVVQVGAYTDAGALREARARVEKLGLKTYTQVIETDAGKRTRVRVGPFEERGDADAAARKLKAAGLPANILAL